MKSVYIYQLTTYLFSLVPFVLHIVNFIIYIVHNYNRKKYIKMICIFLSMDSPTKDERNSMGKGAQVLLAIERIMLIISLIMLTVLLILIFTLRNGES